VCLVQCTLVFKRSIQSRASMEPRIPEIPPHPTSLTNHENAQAQTWLSPLELHFTEAGLGHVSEIFEGDVPHRPCGCIAQAWSVAEILRVYLEDVRGLRLNTRPRGRSTQSKNRQVA
jgi:glycogen debranching enzyme